MKVVDTHSDALYKMQYMKHKEKRTVSFYDESQIESNGQRLVQGKVFIQLFALFISPKIHPKKRWRYILEQIQLFQKEVIGKHSNIKHINTWEQVNRLQADEIGAVLTLEGAEPIDEDFDKLIYLYEQGVLSVGLTWNNTNACADGCSVKEGKGLTLFGEQIVKKNNERKILTDVSHLSEKSFWDVLEIADYPIASHSNAKAICNHERNLTDEQIKALFKKGGRMHLVFYPPFINENYESEQTTIAHLMKHIDHICALGGGKQIGFGSDFDGIDLYVQQLENASFYPTLINELLKYYSEDDVKGFASNNFLRYISSEN